jgi:hypothetical protein
LFPSCFLIAAVAANLSIATTTTAVRIIATAVAFLEKDYTVTKQPAFNYNL